MGLTKVRRNGTGKKTDKSTTRGNVHLPLESIEILLLKPNLNCFSFLIFCIFNPIQDGGTYQFSPL